MGGAMGEATGHRMHYQHKIFYSPNLSFHAVISIGEVLQVAGCIGYQCWVIRVQEADNII